MDYITSAKAAEKLGISRRMVNAMCQKGTISGSKKVGNRWMIPLDYIEKMGNGKFLIESLLLYRQDFADKRINR